MTAPDLHAEIKAAARSLRRCDCGSAVTMAYHPGCTFIHCMAEKKDVAATPDWDPTGLAARWNNRAPDLTGPAA